MTNPPSHIRVSVEETENGYIVQAGSAVARISRTILGYAVAADSQVLKEEYNLSPGVEKVRKSAHIAVQFSADPTDETRLILRTQRNFLLLSQAVEMVCGFLPKDFPREDEWKLLSAWKNERDVVVEPEHAVASQIGETTTPVGISSGEVQGEFGTTLQDIVSEVEDTVDAEYQSNSWRVIPNKSAEKFLDKSAFEFHETGVPKDVCDFFGATNLPSGSRKPIYLISNSKRLTGYIIKDMTKSGRVKLRWDDGVSDIISKSRRRYGDNLSLVFLKMLDLDTYNIIVKSIVGLKKLENNTIPSVLEETRDNTESAVHPSQDRVVECSPDVLRIHEAVSKLPRYRFNKSTEIDVDNGLLVVFKDGEKYGEYDRIVYVGINKASGRLPGRIQEFISGSKDGVVLRKYIGEALLRKDGDSYARIWAKDASSPEKLRRIGTFYDPQKEKKTEVRVSSYLKKHMSFSVIEIPNSTRRSLLQDELVSTLQEAYSQSSVSSTWLGRYHSDPKIRSGALWMIGNANSRSFNEEELQTFLKEIQNSQSLERVVKSTPSTSETVSYVPSPVSFSDKMLTEQRSLYEKYKQKFVESFPNGITITNRLQLRKLSREFQTVNPDFTTLEKEEAFALVTQIVQKIGVFCGENVWIPESSISINEDILNKIISYISTNLETFPIVDINRIYSDFRIWLPSSISSVQILNEILKQKLTKGYYFFENCVSNLESGSWKFVIKRVLKEYLLSCGEAVHISQIEEEFPHASQNLLREALADVKAGFVGGGRSQNYAHVGIFELTDDVIKDIQNLLLENMDENTSSITTERIEQLIHESYPELFSTYIDRNMLQEILEYYLSDVFEFRRGAVTLPGAKKRSATDIVIQHFGKKTIFTLQDVYDYIEEHHYSVAIMGVLLPLLQEHNFLRVDAQTFVSAKAVLISNDVYETISVKLSHSLYRGYICSDKIADIFSYPFISEWPMNPYLLESIVRVHGSKMRPPLQVIDYYTGPEKPRGIIVKKNGKFSTHDDVIHDLLLKRHEENPFDSVDEAIQFLKSEKYMERKTNSINEICKTIINTK